MTIPMVMQIPWGCDPTKFGAKPTCTCPVGYRWKEDAVPEAGSAISFKVVCSSCGEPWKVERWVSQPKVLGTIGPPEPVDEPRIRFVPTRYQQEFMADRRPRVLYGHRDPTIVRLGVLETHIRRLRAALEACATPNVGWPETWIADFYEDSRKDVP